MMMLSADGAQGETVSRRRRMAGGLHSPEKYMMDAARTITLHGKERFY